MIQRNFYTSDKVDRIQLLIGITDTDGDGVANGADDDDDGVLDSNDAFPLTRHKARC